MSQYVNCGVCWSTNAAGCLGRCSKMPPEYFALTPPASLTEADVRRIVREEIRAAAAIAQSAAAAATKEPT